MSSPQLRVLLLKRVLVLGLLAVLVSACAPSASPVAQEIATPVPVLVKLSTQPFIGSAPIFIAQEEAYFAKHGVQAEFVPANSSVEALPLLIQGQLDLMLIAVNPAFFNAVVGGSDVRVVLGVSQLRPEGCASLGVVAREAEADRLRSVGNWKGLTLSTTPTGLQGISGFWLDRALEQGGLTLADIEVVKLPPASGADALQSGSVALVETAEPWITRMVQQADAEMVVAAQDVVPNAQYSVVVFGPHLVRDVDLGGRVAAAYLEGLRQYGKGNTDRNVEILAKYTELPSDLLKQICWPSVRTDGSVNLDSLVEFQAWAVEQGFLDKVLDPALFWDGRFLEQALRSLADSNE